MSDFSAAKILVIEPKAAIRTDIADALTQAGFEVLTAGDAAHALHMFYATPPQCVVLRHNMPSTSARPILEELKSDNLYGHLPMVIILDSDDLKSPPDWNKIPADDYLLEPFSQEEVVSRVRLTLTRATRDLNANPLTGLPGNMTISLEAERRLQQRMPFAFAYLDIDHFKSYNDTYGFVRGDEVLRMTARIVVNSVRALESTDTYVGHVGGDDFVFMSPSNLIVPACRRICSDFDLIVRNFYDAQDRKNGFIRSTDRQGNPRTFPLMTISIGVVDTEVTQVSHVAELMARVVEVKSYAKRMEGSAYLIDRRHK